MGSLAVVLIMSLIICFPQIKGQQAEQAEAIAFSLWGQKWKICNCFGIKTAEENGYKLNRFSALLIRCSSESFVGLTRNQKQKSISLSSHLSEVETTCLFYTGCGDAVLRYVRYRPSAVVMTTAVLSTKTGEFSSFTCWDLSLHLLLIMADSAALTGLNVTFKATSVSKMKAKKEPYILRCLTEKLSGSTAHPAHQRKVTRAEEWPRRGNLIPSHSESYAASPDSVNKFVLSLDLKITRMTASLTAGSSWCQNEGEFKEEKSSVSRGFLFIYLFSFFLRSWKMQVCLMRTRSSPGKGSITMTN